MKNRKLIISYIVAFLVLVLGISIKNKLSNKPQTKVEPIKKEIDGVFTDKVVNEIKPITVKSNGSLVAKHKVDLFSEVQGVFESSSHLFKPGVYFKKGEVLLRLNSEEFKANLQIQKSNLYQNLVRILPDLRLDYPGQFEKWEQYIEDFNMDKRVADLPAFDNQKEKLFITGKGIPTAFYVVRNLQKRLSKYTIYAPFSGVLTNANVNKGTLISPGQKIGTFINPNSYELEVDINATTAKLIKIGSILNLHTLDNSQQWSGKVARINPILNAKSQSMKYYVQVSGKGLNEGMYLEADIESKNDIPLYEINRSLLVNNNKVYCVKNDSILVSIPINIIHVGNKTAYVEGLVDGTQVLSQSLPGAFDGKIVRIID